MNVHASPLGDDGRVAVMIEPARRSDLLPILLESYDLTGRESEFVLLVSRGLSTKEIAAELCISTHTVGDHIKVIFSKVGVSSRGELVAKLFSEHIAQPFHERALHL
jgi:DNA-binding NarL/FixJ family response regulator